MLEIRISAYVLDGGASKLADHIVNSVNSDESQSNF